MPIPAASVKASVRHYCRRSCGSVRRQRRPAQIRRAATPRGPDGGRCRLQSLPFPAGASPSESSAAIRRPLPPRDTLQRDDRRRRLVGFRRVGSSSAPARDSMQTWSRPPPCLPVGCSSPPRAVGRENPPRAVGGAATSGATASASPRADRRQCLGACRLLDGVDASAIL